VGDLAFIGSPSFGAGIKAQPLRSVRLAREKAQRQASHVPRSRVHLARLSL